MFIYARLSTEMKNTVLFTHNPIILSMYTNKCHDYAQNIKALISIGHIERSPFMSTSFLTKENDREVLNIFLLVSTGSNAEIFTCNMD